jgi:hypothetical protein
VPVPFFRAPGKKGTGSRPRGPLSLAESFRGRVPVPFFRASRSRWIAKLPPPGSDPFDSQPASPREVHDGFLDAAPIVVVADKRSAREQLTRQAEFRGHSRVAMFGVDVNQVWDEPVLRHRPESIEGRHPQGDDPLSIGPAERQEGLIKRRQHGTEFRPLAMLGAAQPMIDADHGSLGRVTDEEPRRQTEPGPQLDNQPCLRGEFAGQEPLGAFPKPTGVLNPGRAYRPLGRPGVRTGKQRG